MVVADPIRIVLVRRGVPWCPFDCSSSVTSTMSAGIQVDRSKRPAVFATHPSTVLNLAVLYTMNETGVNSFRQDTVHHNGKGRQLPFAVTRDTVHYGARRRQLSL